VEIIVKLIKNVITRDQAIAISPDYVKFAEGDFASWNKVNKKFKNLKRNQSAITFTGGQFVKVKVTLVNNRSIQAIDGPIVRVSNGECSWRVDGCGYAWPI